MAASRGMAAPDRQRRRWNGALEWCALEWCQRIPGTGGMVPEDPWNGTVERCVEPVERNPVERNP